MNSLRHPGVQAALGSALLFGAGTPLAKLIIGEVDPWMLAGLLYLGSGAGLTLWRVARRAPRVRLRRRELPPLVGAVLFGGLVAPVLLMFGLAHMPASGASLLLNAEAVLTACLAWFVFKESFDRRVALGMVAIVSGALALTVPTGADLGTPWPALAILGACLCWGLDNNLTRMVALTDATWLAAVKGAVAGPTNLVLALAAGATLPRASVVGLAMAIGLVAYGVSLALFITALRHIGVARAGAYYSVAPFFGALIAVLLGAPVTIPLVIAGLLMGLGVWLHLTERHDHEHSHEAIEHDHWHTHDEPHQHDHAGEAITSGAPHRHSHVHEAIVHAHGHFPDADHRHEH